MSIRLVPLLFLLALVVTTLPAAAAQTATPDSPIPLADARVAFEQAGALSDRDGGELWGKPLYGPMLFVDPQSRFVIANEPDREGFLTAKDGLYVGTLPVSMNVANTTTKWAGVQWAMVMWPLGSHEHERGTLMMHEHFHRLAPDLGLALALRDNHHLDAARGRAWLRLEFRALAAALEAETPLESEAMRDALLFRAYRRSLASGAKEQERDVELNEGLAEYTGVRLGGHDAVAQKQRTIQRLLGSDRAASFVRSFAYATGPAWGLLLDEADPTWRSDVKQTTDLADLLARAIRYRAPRDLKDQTMARLEPYGGQAILDEEAARETARAERQQHLRRTFIDGPVLRIPMSGDMQFSFGPSGQEALDGYGTVYPSMRLTGPWGVLESSGPILWLTEPKHNQHFRVPAGEMLPTKPTAEPITGEGWTLMLNPGWRLKAEAKRGCYVVGRVE